MHANEAKLVNDLSDIVGSQLYLFAKEIFNTCGFSNQFIVKSITKDGTIAFGNNNMLHWSVVSGWVVGSEICDYDFTKKITEALDVKYLNLIGEANEN